MAARLLRDDAVYMNFKSERSVCASSHVKAKWFTSSDPYRGSLDNCSLSSMQMRHPRPQHSFSLSAMKY
jgi:hypothetical protein